MERSQDYVLQELNVRLKRIEGQVLETELALEVAMVKEDTARIEDLLSDIETLVRKLDWFRNSIRRAERVLQEG